MKIAHIVNPVFVDESRDLFWQQPITFKTLENARKFTSHEVELMACFYPEDEHLVPDGWTKTKVLQKSTLGLGYSPVRKLPYFREILDRLSMADADILIETNADIGVQPYFYDLVAHLVNEGHEAFVINKRILPEVDIFKSVDGIPVMYATWGGPHAGHDCFVFKKELYPNFVIGDIVNGTPWSEATILFSMVAFGNNFAEFKNAHATFHIGDRRIWLPVSHNDYRIHNTNEVGKVLRLLTRKYPEMLDNSTIQTYIGKLKTEVLGYKDPRYNKDCHYFAEK